jgi:hypothetical protein
MGAGPRLGLSPSPRLLALSPCDHTKNLVHAFLCNSWTLFHPTLGATSARHAHDPFYALTTWPHGPMRPTPPTLGAQDPLTVRNFGTNFGMHMCVGFRHGKCPEARLDTQRCILVNQRQQA